ncbi:MAG: hypothetical protein NTX62_03955, partial [Deltaproteobacteria bacterium]|nr:hypothetical protein [Deltaproteobacteria bacterium]
MNRKKLMRRICLLSLIILGLFGFFTPQNAQSARLAGEEDTITTSGKKPLTTQPAKTDDAKKPALQKAATTADQPPVAPGMPTSEDEDAPSKPAPVTATPASVQPAKAGEPAKPPPLARPPIQPPPPPPLMVKPPVEPAKAESAKKPTATTPLPAAAPVIPSSAAASPKPAPAAPAAKAPSVAPASAQPAKAGETPSPAVTKTPVKDTRYVTIDFDNVDIQVFVKFISELTGKNFVIDDKVKGKVTVISPRKIAVDDVYKVFQSVLEINGFATVEAGEVIKIVPTQVAKEKGLETRTDEDLISPEDRMVTQII